MTTCVNSYSPPSRLSWKLRGNLDVTYPKSNSLVKSWLHFMQWHAVSKMRTLLDNIKRDGGGYDHGTLWILRSFWERWLPAILPTSTTQVEFWQGDELCWMKKKRFMSTNNNPWRFSIPNWDGIRYKQICRRKVSGGISNLYQKYQDSVFRQEYMSVF